MNPLMIPLMISNMAAGNIAIRYGAKGICENVVTACATGTNAIGDAFRQIKDGRQDVMFAGGAEAAICRIGIAGFTNLTALSKNPDPKDACKPFDKDRDGFVMSEGAGVLILEELEHAKARGAKIYGEIVGYGSNADAYHITTPLPDGSGAARAMELAMEEAGITPEQVSELIIGSVAGLDGVNRDALNTLGQALTGFFQTTLEQASSQEKDDEETG